MGTPPARDADFTAYVRNLVRVEARKLSRMPGFRTSEAEDIEQELLMHLHRQAGEYDPERGAESTFADRIVKNRVRELARERRRLKRGGGKSALSLDEMLVRADGNTTTRSESTTDSDRARRVGSAAQLDQDRVERRLDVGTVLASLPPPLRDLADRLINGTEAGAARALGISRRAIRAQKAKIRAYFEQFGFEVDRRTDESDSA